MNKQRTSAALALCLALGCGDDDSSASSETDTSSSSTGDDAASSTGDGADETGSGGQASGTSQGGTSEGSSGETDDSAGESGDDDGGLPIDCEGATDNRSVVVCAAEAFLDTLDEGQRATVLYDWTDNEAKTAWSNLPGVTRSGITYGELGEESRAAAMVVAQAALSSQGYEDFIGLLAADDYLGEQGGGGGGGPGGGGGGLAYASDNYIIAFIGTPSTSSDWMLQLGGHHMAYNITYTDAETGASPNHLGAEPKGEFTVGGESYAPLTDDGEAFFAVFDAMDASTLSSAQISGSYGDVLLGPAEYGTGSYDAVEFPTGSQREGILASSLSAAEQALVVEAIRAWAGDYADEVSEPLMDSYTSDEAFADTYVGWSGSSAPDPDVNGTYLRIDGPEVWIELVCQNGVVIQGETHYHTIYRDKARDYGGSL